MTELSIISTGVVISATAAGKVSVGIDQDLADCIGARDQITQHHRRTDYHQIISHAADRLMRVIDNAADKLRLAEELDHHQHRHDSNNGRKCREVKQQCHRQY